MTLPVIVVGGIPALSAALEQSGVFPRVLTAPDISGLKQLAVGQDLRGLRASDVVFVLGDTLPAEPNFPASEFIRRVAGAGYRVLIVALSPAAAELQRQFPQTVLLNQPLRLNDLMFALANFGFPVNPLANGSEAIELSNSSPAAPVFFQTSGSGWAAPEPTPPPTPASTPTPRTQTPAPAPFASPTPQNTGGWGMPGPTPAPVQQPVQPVPPVQPVQQPFQPAAPQSPAGQPWNPNPQRPRSLADFAASAPTQSSPQPFNPAPQAQPWSAGPVSQPASWASGSASDAGRAGYPSQTKRRGMVITTAVSKGGTGKSTLTLNLAAYLGSRFKNANPSRTVCIIDANFQQADTGKYLGQYTPNIVNLIKDPSLMTQDRVLSALVNRADMNFSALLGPATPDDALSLLTAETGRGGTSFSARFYSEVLDLLRPHFDYIFIDTPVAEKYHSLFSEFALPRADFLVVPVIPSKQTVHNTYMWLNSAVIAPKHAQGAGLRPEQVGIVLNRAEEGVGYGEIEVMEELRKFNFLGSVPETIDWKRANNDGELIAAKNKSDVNEAFARILGQVTGEPLLLNGLPPELIEERASFGDRLRSLFRGRE